MYHNLPPTPAKDNIKFLFYMNKLKICDITLLYIQIQNIKYEWNKFYIRRITRQFKIRVIEQKICVKKIIRVTEKFGTHIPNTKNYIYKTENKKIKVR